MPSPWPAGFDRVPSEDWTTAPVEGLALRYDTVENHGWYANLDPSVDAVASHLGPGDVVVDYSGGTGIFAERLLRRVGDLSFGLLDVDSSPKFLRLALEKLRAEERVAFRLIRFRKDLGRLEYVDEVAGAALLSGRVDAVVSTNAIHLYRDLEDTLSSWRRILRPDGRVHAQSGNVAHPDAQGWILDDTVEAVHRAALDLVAKDARFARFRPALADPARRAAHDALRRKFFLPPRSIEVYRAAFERAGFRLESVTTRRVAARTAEWRDFLSVYHEGVLGWIGGSERVEGRPPSREDVEARLEVLSLALDAVLGGRPSFEAVWTYLDARPDHTRGT